MTENKELLPCPFCGKKISEVSDFWDIMRYKNDVNRYSVYCNHCKSTTGYYSTTEDAIKAWNTRAESPKLDIAVRALEESINFIDNLDGEFIERALMLEKLQSALQQIKG